MGGGGEGVCWMLLLLISDILYIREGNVFLREKSEYLKTDFCGNV